MQERYRGCHPRQCREGPGVPDVRDEPGGPERSQDDTDPEGRADGTDLGGREILEGAADTQKGALKGIARLHERVSEQQRGQHGKD
jgi:hypothetical protein